MVKWEMILNSIMREHIPLTIRASIIVYLLNETAFELYSQYDTPLQHWNIWSWFMLEN
jgi:hypothetical protein